MYRYSANKWRPLLSEAVITFVCAVAFSLASRYRVDGNCEISLGLFADTVVLWIFFLFGFVLLRMFLGKKHDSKLTKVVCALKKGKDLKYPTFVLAGAILIIWIPLLVLLFPGIICYDTTHMIAMFYSEPGSGYFTAHHPVFDTFLYGSVVSLVTSLTGSWKLSVLVITILQCILTAIAFSRVVVYSNQKLNVSDTGSIILALIFALFPLFPLFSMYISKDSLFSAFFILFLVEFIEIVRTKGEVLENKRTLFVFIAYCLLCCLTKKLGVYIVVGSIIFYLIAVRGNWKRVLLCGASSAVAMFILYPAIIAALGIPQGGAQEMLSVPFQQTARLVKVYPDDISQEEKVAIDDLLDFDTLAERYEFDTADPVKGYQQLSEKSSEVYSAYIKAWISGGLRHPGVYFDAFAAQNARWFSFEPIEPMFRWSWDKVFDGTGISSTLVDRAGYSDRSIAFVEDRYYFLANLPVFKLFLTVGFWATLLPAFVLSVLIRKNNRYMICALVPIILSIVLGMWLSPTAIGVGNGIRYLIPVIYSLPILLCVSHMTMVRGDYERKPERGKHCIK